MREVWRNDKHDASAVEQVRAVAEDLIKLAELLAAGKVKNLAIICTDREGHTRMTLAAQDHEELAKALDRAAATLREVH